MDIIQETINGKLASREKDLDYTIRCHSNPLIGYILEKTVLFCMAVVEHTGGVNYFYTDTKCNDCGICAKVCLSQKIKLVEHKPVWQKSVLCYMCFACLNYCPQAAVQISDIPGVKSFTAENGRYPHPYATVKDISRQKEM